MVLHPEVLKKAQKEIDVVVGQDRLPEFDDRDKLPYVECVMQETMRYAEFGSRSEHLLGSLNHKFRLQMVPRCSPWLVPDSVIIGVNHYDFPQAFLTVHWKTIYIMACLYRRALWSLPMLGECQATRYMKCIHHT